MRVAEQDRAMRGLELEITRRFKSYGVLGFADAAERRDLSNRVAELSGGRNFLEWISDGATSPLYFPSIYVRFGPKSTPISAAESVPGQVHPAFRVGSSIIKDLFIGKYQGCIQASNAKNLLLSLRGVDPANSQNFATFQTAGRNNGAGHHMMTNSEWAYLSLLCKSQGFQPRGNNYYGKDYAVPTEAGEVSYIYDSSGTKYNGRVLTGSGPLAWSHDGSPYGVWDLNGNVTEMVDGLQLKNGLIQIIENNNAASPDTGINALYKSILDDEAHIGTLASDGTAGELKFVTAAADYGITVPGSGASDGFKLISQTYQKTVEGVATQVAAPKLLKELCIIPHDSGDYGTDGFWYNLAAPCVCYRGGSFSYTSRAGVSYLSLSNTASDTSVSIGVRPAFYRV